MRLRIHQIVLEEVTFKHRDGYLALPPTTPIPETWVDLSMEHMVSDSDPNAMLVRLTATSAEGGLHYFSVRYVILLALEYEAGESTPPDLVTRVLVTGGTMLFPFVREVVANLSSKGRFGATWLAPTNFNSFDFVREATAQP